MLSTLPFEDVAEKLRAIAHPVRLLILFELTNHGELTVSQLQDRLEFPQPVISQHLTKLRHKGILDVTREGTHAFYRITHPQVTYLTEYLREEDSVVETEEISR